MRRAVPTMRALAVSLALVIGLAGCGTSSVDSGFSLDFSAPDDPVGADTGLLIGSVSWVSDRSWTTFGSAFYYGEKDGSHLGSIQTGYVLGLINRSSDLPDADGQLIAIELPAGSYSFRGW